MQRFFTNEEFEIQQKNKKLLLPEGIFHHAINVLRMKEGSQFELVTKKEKVFLCEISELKKKEGYFMIQDELIQSVELPVKVTIVCGVSKGDKAEEIVKKGTQLGADQFIFFNSKYSVARWNEKKVNKKITRLQTIAKNAAEQSHRTHIPKVSWQISIKNIGELAQNYQSKIVAYEESAKKGEKTALNQEFDNLKENLNGQMIALFGPEGGIDLTEIDELRQYGFETVGLGPRILRAETAPLYLLAALSFAFELE